MTRIVVILSTLLLTVAASADPPRRFRGSCPQVVPFVEHCQETICAPSQIVSHQVIPHSINAATLYADTHLHLVEVPVPYYVFQNLTAYQPAPVVQLAPVAPIQQASVTQGGQDGVGTDEQLAALLGAPQQQTAIQPLAEMKQKCGSCHSAQSGTVKGGLTLFDANGEFAPSTTKNKGLTAALIAARARSTGEDAMPPGVNANPAKRLSEQTIAKYFDAQ